MNQKLKTGTLAALIALSPSVRAQATSADEDPSRREVVAIHGVRFAEALVDKWITEYSALHPEVAFALDHEADDAGALTVIPLPDAPASPATPTATTTVSFGRYAVLPIAGEDNALPDQLTKKKLNDKRLRELFFEKDLTDADFDPNAKEKYDARVYSGVGSHSVAHSFAGHFGYDTGRLKGKKIAGDDIYLNSAVQKDAKGVSFNALNYVFDIRSRRLTEGLVLLPLDVKKEYLDVLAAPDLDATIAMLERASIDLIPVGELTFVLPDRAGPATLRFLEWTLTEGQRYIHPFGFLRLDAPTIAHQQKKIAALETKWLANK
jgi:ABC-type phosphate transport system substrate-binding protein